MKAVLTQLERFNSKKSGVEWVRVSGVNVSTGKTFSTLISGDTLNKSGIKSDVVLTSTELDEFTPVDVSFDDNGRLESIANV